MAVINFSTLNDGDKINLGADNLVFDGGISAAEVSIRQDDKGVELSVGAKSIILKDWVIGNLNSAQVTFGNGSELLVGDTLFALDNDNDANLLAPFFPGNARRDQIRGLGGDDDLSGGEGDDLMFGQVGDDELNGDGGSDRLDGGRGSDTLHGGADDDNIKGFDGNDLIIGGTGADRLEGGNGDDTYRIEAADSPPVLHQHDTVVEFVANHDKFDLMLVGTIDNYKEKRLETNDFGEAMAEAMKLFFQNEGLKDYVFIAGNTKGWLFGEFTDDKNPDLAVEIRNGESLAVLDFADII